MLPPPFTIAQGDSVDLVPWPEDSIDLFVFSPPYWGQRQYGPDSAELGGNREPLEVYIERLVRACRNCIGPMKPHASLVVNIADTWSKSGGAGGDYNTKGSKEGRTKWKQGESGLPAGTVCNVPGRFVDAMLADGWLLRIEIIWNKTVQRAEALPHVRRVRPQHEVILHFVRSMKYAFNVDGLVETGSVWTFKPNSTGDRGSAPFPLELPRRVISMLTPEPVPGEEPPAVGDIFCGSGTTLHAAAELGRLGYGIDLYAGELFG